MTAVAAELAVQSYCFRGFKDNAKTAALVREIGLQRIELCGVHVNFQDPAAHAPAIAAYRDAGVEIVSTGVNRIGRDEAAARSLFEFSKAAGCRYMSVDFPVGEVPEAYRVAEKLAAEYDMKLGIHNHGGRHWLGPAQMLGQVFAETDERIGLCLDTAWALDSRENPVAMAEKFAGRLYGLHLKDFVFDRAGKPEDVVVGTGNLDLPALAAKLEAIGFDGYAVLEYEGDVDNPTPALTKCVEAIRAKM